MLDKQMEMMLRVANELTSEDLDALRGLAPLVSPLAPTDAAVATVEPGNSAGAEADDDAPGIPETDTAQAPRQVNRKAHGAAPVPATTATRGEYERQRTRESKISTVCVGHEREKHDWWPLGTELEGRIGSETFTAVVIENPRVKSGRSLLITSGTAGGKVCITPTRAAIETTESYRQANNLGRGGGVTNGWDFWKPRKTPS